MNINYVEVATFADELGNTVRRYTPQGVYDAKHGTDKMGQPPKVVYTGTATVMVQGPNMPPHKQPVTFQFPDEVTTVQQAFEQFDKNADEMLADMKAKANIQPAHQMPPRIVGPDGKPFMGPNGKPIMG
jgi:hypothetical protein